MKFSEITKQQWPQLSPYLDTCLLPLTGLSGQEQPWEVAEALMKLRDVMDWVEIPYKGRIVTYPAVHYSGEGGNDTDHIDSICRNLKKSGFTYVILITGQVDLQRLHQSREADLIIAPPVEATGQLAAGQIANREAIGQLVVEMWQGNGKHELNTLYE